MKQGDIMQEFIKRYGKWVITGILLFTFVIVAHKMMEKDLLGFDTAIYNFIISFKSPIITEIFKGITFLCSGPFLLILSVALFFIFKNKKYGLLSLVNLIVVVIVNQTLKLIFSRPRPFEWMLINETGFSFPSGHAMASMGFYGMLIYLIWQTGLSKKAKKIWTALLSLLILLVGISRIYLGVHYASDIIAGFTLSLSYLIIATSLVSYYLKCKASVKKVKN